MAESSNFPDIARFYQEEVSDARRRAVRARTGAQGRRARRVPQALPL
ncbi:hypothetical protein ACTMU2_39420 [Cupriavidus basilensis]